VVTADGGPKFLVRNGLTGFVAGTEDAFIESVLQLMRDSALHERMREAAREHVRQYSWDRVFENAVYEAYRSCLLTPLGSAARSPRSQGLIALS
jgi:glycosyltransferase involved in cell wall biosynthesis